MADKFVRKSSIWDLHIHTCFCPKASGEFRNMSVEDYIAGFISLIKNHPDLKLISFTDHNQISDQVYLKFMESNYPLEFIVGTEIDVIFEREIKETKHLIVYFDISKENYLEKRTVIKEINDFLKREIISKNHAIEIQNLLTFLLNCSVNFVLSPHAFKQGKRAISYDWSDEETAVRAKNYADEFFCFWEASGHSEIARAIEFLKEFLDDERVSVISFSDSNSFEKLSNYLNDPPMYFRALPNFKGLQMVGTEQSRIDRSKKCVSENSYGDLIGKVKFENCEIEFSNKLNCIIGGRGSGKSILLDSIASNLKDITHDLYNSKRLSYIQDKDVSVYNYSQTKLSSNTITFDYFSQGYVSKIFEDNDYSDNIKSFFSEDFEQLESIDVDEIKQNNLDEFKQCLNTFDEFKEENISNVIGSYKIVESKGVDLKLRKSDKSSSKLIAYIEIDKIYKKLNDLVPKQLKDDEEIKKMEINLLSLIVEKTYKANNKLLETQLLKNIFIDDYFEYKNNLNELSKKKSDVTKKIENAFKNKSLEIRKRVNIINAYLMMSERFQTYYEKVIRIDNGGKFNLKNVLEIQSPLLYLKEKLEEYLYVENLKENRKDEFSLQQAIDYYCFAPKKTLKNGKTIESLDQELVNFNLKYEYRPEIEYFQDGNYENIKTLSPGTQTNILMEYLIHKDSGKPLLIDQPEDNIDNYTIYNKLTNWFKEAKEKRQIIVVTHDPNIVINADAENVIVASHNAIDEFEYSYGALEYNDILLKASNSLDGGKEAVKRRIVKYGE